MAETTTQTAKPATDVSSGSDTSLASKPATVSKSTASTPVQIALRVALGFAGLSLLVGFFLPWWHESTTGVEGAAATLVSSTGLSLATGGDLVGSPSMLLFLVPALGIGLSAISFMGFKWSGQVAVGIAVSLIGYALYVLLQMFVQRTALGLWVVAGGTFVILLLGVIAWMTGRDRRPVLSSDAGTSARKP